MKTNNEQFLAQINKSSHVLIVLPDHCDNDVICAGLGIFNLMKRQGKELTIVSYSRPNPRLAFLPGFSDVQRTIEHARNFVLSFSTANNDIKDVHYERLDDKLNIYITPKRETISPKDFSFAPGKFMYDLIVVLGAAELQSIGECYEKNADLFFEVPIVNLDYHIANEQFGQLNIVDVKMSGASELAAEIFLNPDRQGPADPGYFSSADCLYAGILEATESFQSPRTTPKTLKLAARLIDAGADHKNIVRHLYKTEDLSTIKLWGRLMMRMRYVDNIRLAWTSVEQGEIEGGPAQIDKLRSIFDRIRSSYRKADTLLLLWEAENNLTRGFIQNANKDLLRQLLGGIDWGNAIVFEHKEPLAQAQESILKILEEGYQISQ